MVSTRKRIGITVVSIAAVAAVTTAAVVLWPEAEAPPASAPVASAPAVSAPPTPSPAPEQYPRDDGVYDLAALPAAQVYSVIPELPLDNEPGGGVLPVTATAAAPSVPVFAEPGAAPVAQLPAEQAHDGTVVPVIEQHSHWVRVLLPARAGLPSAGVVGQTTGWLRTADVTLSESPFSVTVNIPQGTVTVSGPGDEGFSAAGFGYGAPATPTPLGRSFVMTTFVDPAAGYTRGHPITAVAMQSPTLDGFGGGTVAVTAFHYHDSREGPVSNGCIRVDGDTAVRLAALPLGTPVIFEG